MNKNITHHIWKGKQIDIREDRYVSATDMARSENQRLDAFLKYSETQKYLKVLSKWCNIPIDKNNCISTECGNTIQKN